MQNNLTLLANCPFCGSAEVTYRNLEIDGHMFTAIACKDCGGMGPQFFAENKDSAGLAQVLWNERKDSKQANTDSKV